MKRQFTVLAVTAMMAVTAMGDDDLRQPSNDMLVETPRPMLVEGRTWNTMWVKHTWADNDDMVAITYYATYTVTDKTEKGGKDCFRISSTFNTEVEPEGANVTILKTTDLFMYEEDGKVYSYNEYPGQWVLEFDNGIRQGDAFDNIMVVSSIDTIEVKGMKYKRFSFEFPFEGVWVEGIGSSLAGMRTGMHGLATTDGPITDRQTLSVYDGDKCIFEADDFKAISTGVSSPRHKPSNNASPNIYDLQGRRVSRDTHTRGVYVKNGKLIIDN